MDKQAIQEQFLQTQTIRDNFNSLLQEKNYRAIFELFQANLEVVEQENDLAIARCLLSVCEQEMEAGQRILIEKVNSLEEIATRYTRLMFYLRRIEFDIMDDSFDEFNWFIKENQISVQELFVVMYCGNIDREKVLQIIKDKIMCGEIVL